jgi:hypothetical protein
LATLFFSCIPSKGDFIALPSEWNDDPYRSAARGASGEFVDYIVKAVRHYPICDNKLFDADVWVENYEACFSGS